MGGPLSVTLADIYMIRKENDVVKPLNHLSTIEMLMTYIVTVERIVVISYIMN